MNGRLVYLEGYRDGERTPRRLALRALPAVVGRQADCDLQLVLERISRRHARFEHDGDGVTITDLGSTNGTFVNRQRIEQPTRLSSGDVVHLADHEFCYIEIEQKFALPGDGELTLEGIPELPGRYPIHIKEFRELMDKRLVRGFRQVVVDGRGHALGCELLGRSAHPGLQLGPMQLFEIAKSLDEEARLSELFRDRGFESCARHGVQGLVFFNTHPEECRDTGRLLLQMRRLRERYPDMGMVFEVHERAVTDIAMMREIAAVLRSLDIRLAYDDFGAGEARMLELVEVPPDILKFDIALVRGLTVEDTPKRRLVATLNQLVHDMGISTLAEGVETEENAAVCRELGIDHLQGYLFGRPEPIGPDD